VERTPGERLTDEQLRSALRNVIRHGIAGQATVTLTGGVFLVGLAVNLGLSNTMIGFLAAIPPLMQFLQIPSVAVIDRYRARKPICVYTAVFSRLPWLLVALIPFAFPTEFRTTVLVWAILANAALAAVSNAAWNPWIRDLVPQEQLGSFFGRRMSLATAAALVVSLVAGGYLDLWKRSAPDHEIYAYSVLYFAGFLTGLIAVRYLRMIPEPRTDHTERQGSVFKSLQGPFRDANFKKLLVFLGSWNFAANLAAPFFTVYMLTRLGLAMSTVVVLSVLSQLTNLFFYRVWGLYADRYSHKSILRVSGPLFMGCILAWTFTTMPERHALSIPLLVVIHILMGISTAGVMLGSNNIGLKLAPRGMATPYLAASSLVNSVAAGIAPIVGGRCVDFFVGHELSWTLRWTSPQGDYQFRTLDFQTWDFFFFLAFALGLFSVYRLSSVRERGEVRGRVVVHDLVDTMRRRMGSLSTAGGLRRMIHFPYSLLRDKNSWRNGPSVGDSHLKDESSDGNLRPQ